MVTKRQYMFKLLYISPLNLIGNAQNFIDEQLYVNGICDLN